MTYEQKIEAAASDFSTKNVLVYQDTEWHHIEEIFKAGVQWARENPDSETVEMREDRGRLEWMIANSAIISKSRNIFYCEIINGMAVKSYGEPTPREAIDAARAESGRG